MISNSSTYGWMIVGCGLTGATLAERIASQLNERVLIIDRRNHIAGNAYDFYDDSGILASKYGAHIFHTQSRQVWNYVNRFARFNNYVHFVDALVDGKYYSIPVNLDTINSFYEIDLSEEQLPAFIAQKRVPIDHPKNAEEAVINKIGWELYEAFYKNYTIKQWGLNPTDLDPGVTLRLPVRMNRDKRYFSDPWQGIPVGGYTKMVEAMLRHENIDVILDVDYRQISELVKFKRMIFTGSIDEFFNYGLGKLPYRSLRFEFETHDREHFQHIGVVNYPNNFDYTRIVEYKFLNEQSAPKTTISYEYPCWNDAEPYYPVPSSDSRSLFSKYGEAADKLSAIFFCGRLGTYNYYNMDQCIGQALHLFSTQIAKKEKLHVSTNKLVKFDG
ncbi:MAG TPA: UDP-galactopyranose mutase [Candidatus Acidoferrales bacterium]|nr:UDP-galactopyranose mutase [Candidatus Acidoferrales bacterium]